MSEEESTKGSEVSTESTSDEPASIGDSPTDTNAGQPAPERPERRRKKKKVRAKKASSGRSELDAAGFDRPSFVLDFPEDPALEPLIAAFESGNYAYVREHAPALARTTERADVKAAALELARRIEPDPLVKFLLGIAIALFLVVVAYVYHSHGN